LPQEQFGLRRASLPDRLLELPPSIFNPNRIRIMLALYYETGADFTELKKKLNLSDGALATHLKALLRDELIATQPDRSGSRERTAYLITPKGLQTIDKLLNEFENIRKAIPE